MFEVQTIVNNVRRWEQAVKHFIVSNSVANGGIAFQAFAVHRFTDRNPDVDVVVDLYVLFPFIIAMQTSCILGHNAFPCYWWHEKECVEASIVKPLANVFTCGDDDKWLCGWDGLQVFHLLAFFLGTFRANKSNDVRTMWFEKICQHINMSSSTCEYDRWTSFFQRLNDIFDDK